MYYPSWRGYPGHRGGEELRFGNDIVYVLIKIHVCYACGERYYDRRTARFLEEVR